MAMKVSEKLQSELKPVRVLYVIFWFQSCATVFVYGIVSFILERMDRPPQLVAPVLSYVFYSIAAACCIAAIFFPSKIFSDDRIVAAFRKNSPAAPGADSPDEGFEKSIVGFFKTHQTKYLLSLVFAESIAVVGLVHSILLSKFSTFVIYGVLSLALKIPRINFVNQTLDRIMYLKEWGKI